jgi:hypothetical protein
VATGSTGVPTVSQPFNFSANCGCYIPVGISLLLDNGIPGNPPLEATCSEFAVTSIT